MNVGFIGLGAMGMPMAKRVVAAGYKTYTTFHRRREPAEELRALGAEIKSTPRDVAASAEVIITILPADAELREAVFGPQGILAGFSPGKVLVEMTSGTAMAMHEVEQSIRGLGGQVLDAPVSGGTTAAAQGTLTIMAAGDVALLERCRPLLETMGTRIVHVGEVGHGKVIKMVNQALAAIHLLAIGEAFALGVKCGVDPATLYDVIKTSSGYSKMMDLRLPSFLLEAAPLHRPAGAGPGRDRRLRRCHRGHRRWPRADDRLPGGRPRRARHAGTGRCARRQLRGRHGQRRRVAGAGPHPADRTGPHAGGRKGLVMGPIRALVADDHSLVRAGFRSILSDEDDIEVVAEAKDGAEALTAAVTEIPDVVLMDIRMPGTDGLEATRLITAHPRLHGTRSSS